MLDFFILLKNRHDCKIYFAIKNVMSAMACFMLSAVL